MKFTIFGLLLALIFSACSQKKTGGVSNIADDKMKIPIILLDDDVAGNDRVITNDISRALYKNSIYKQCDVLLKEKKVCINIVVHFSNEHIHAIHKISITYENNIDGAKVVANYNATSSLTGDSRELYAYVYKNVNSLDQIHYKIGEKIDNIDIEDITENIDTFSNEDIKNFTNLELLNIHKDIVNIHNKYIPLREMRN